MRTSRNLWRQTGWLAALLLGLVLMPRAASAQAEGECASGFCGTPNNNGGGCGCGCGGSILVNNTDLGETYSTSDDYDADGIEDDFDNCAFVPNRDQADSDGDGVGNVCDNCPSASNATQADTDGDHAGNACDDDADNDGKANAADSCPLVPNPAQADGDGDGQGDVCDVDSDNDGVPNATDNCPLIKNADQAVMPGAACDGDQDADGVPDTKDNCAGDYNPDQKDTDMKLEKREGDAAPRLYGDACDDDDDDDEAADTYDNCKTVKNPDQKDDDHDLQGNGCDTDGYCFVTSKNIDATKCLDPRAFFKVTTSRPPEPIATGSELFLAIYSNRAVPPPGAPNAGARDGVGVKYSFVIASRPAGSEARIDNAVGTVSASEAFEYRFGDKRPIFRPDLPGTYEITLAADLLEDDPDFPGSRHASDTVKILVQGDAKGDAAGGCAAVPPIVPPRAGAIVGLSGLFLLGLVFIGRRRS